MNNQPKYNIFACETHFGLKQNFRPRTIHSWAITHGSNRRTGRESQRDARGSTKHSLPLTPHRVVLRGGVSLGEGGAEEPKDKRLATTWLVNLGGLTVSSVLGTETRLQERDAKNQNILESGVLCNIKLFPLRISKQFL